MSVSPLPYVAIALISVSQRPGLRGPAMTSQVVSMGCNYFIFIGLLFIAIELLESRNALKLLFYDNNKFNLVDSAYCND